MTNTARNRAARIFRVTHYEVDHHLPTVTSQGAHLWIYSPTLSPNEMSAVLHALVARIFLLDATKAYGWKKVEVSSETTGVGAHGHLSLYFENMAPKPGESSLALNALKTFGTELKYQGIAIE